MKLKICDNCGRERPIWKTLGRKRYCKLCWSAHCVSVKQPTISKPLSPRSKKREKDDREYSKLRKSFLAQHPVCEVNVLGCLTTATDVHHKKGRGKYYLDTTTWLAACRVCHKFIEEHPDIAKEKKWSENKL